MSELCQKKRKYTKTQRHDMPPYKRTATNAIRIYQDQQFEQIQVESSLDMEILKTSTKQKLVTGEVRWENCT